MRAPTEILGVRYFLLGVIFTRTNTRVESSHQGTPQNKNKSFSLSFPDCQSLWAGSAYITLGVASTIGPDHYILPHITQRIQAASAFQAGPHFISYPGAVPTLSRLHRAEVFINDCAVKGPKSMFDGRTIPGNDQIWVFVWKYAESIQELLARVLESGATISGSKMVLVTPRLQLLGAEVAIDGAHVSHEVTAKLARWPPCRNPMEVRGFLGTVGVVQCWIRDFARIAKPLTLLTKKMALSKFEWTEEAQGAMDLLKNLVSTMVPVRMLDYELACKVKQPDQRESDVGLVLIHVDASNIGVGWMIAQRLEDAEYPVVFGSITLNEHKGHYSQPKLELYRVFRALKVE